MKRALRWLRPTPAAALGLLALACFAAAIMRADYNAYRRAVERSAPATAPAP